MAPTHPTTPISLIQTFLSCVKSKDTTQMLGLAHPDATACLIRHNVPQYQPLSTAITRLAEFEGDISETCWDEVEHVDGEYAVVRTKFRIDVGGEAHQTGTSTFTCLKTPESGWLILTMTDIAREQGSGGSK